jgi:hypothetical protein
LNKPGANLAFPSRFCYKRSVSVARLFATVSLLLGAFCPIGAHALVHAFNSAHVHSHDDGTTHAHEHDAEGHHHEHEMRHTDDVARIAVPSSKFAPSPRVEWLAYDVATPLAEVSPRLVGTAILGPPLILPRNLVAPSSAGRAPPA